MTTLAYFPAIRAGYIWDDDAYLTQNKLVQDSHGLWRIWFEPAASPQYYPLVFTTFWLEHHLWGLHPMGYHVVNVLLHAVSAVLVWRLLSRFNVPGALLCAFLFAVHPVHVESVAWITERKNVLSGFFYLAALSVYLRRDPAESAEPDRSMARGYFPALALFACALLSKSVTATLPAAILVLIWWRRGSLQLKDVTRLSPFFAIGLIAAIHTAWFEETHVGAAKVHWGLSPLDRCLVAGRVVWFYLGKLLWPAELVFYYPRWKIDAGQIWQFAFPLAALASVFVVWNYRNRIGRGPLSALLFFGGTLFPVLGFAKVYPMIFSFVADHFQYLASLGIIVLFGAAATRATNGGLVALTRPVQSALSACLVLALATLTWIRCGAFADEETLWRVTLQKNPAAWAASNNLGALLRERGDKDEALRCFQDAVDAQPDYEVALDNLGLALAQAGRQNEALVMLRRAVTSNPYFGSAHRNLGRLLCDLGQVEEAMKHLQAAVLLLPDSHEAHEDLANGYFKQGRADLAIPEYQKVLQLNPGYALGHANLGAALASIGRLPEAESQLRRSLELDSRLPLANYTLGSILSAHGQPLDAVAHLKRAIAQQPVYPAAHANLAIAFAAAGQPDEAVSHFQEAARQAPADADIRFNLAKTLEGIGRTEEAAAQYREVLKLNPQDAQARDALEKLNRAEAEPRPAKPAAHPAKSEPRP